MITGAETPSVLSIQAARARPEQGGAVFVSAPNASPETPPADQIELSSEARERLDDNAGNPELLQQGRGAVNTGSGDFQQLVKEVQERIMDEDRIPPSILKQIRQLLESAQSKESAKVDKFA